MKETLLATKLRVPRLPVQHVPRARLFALLERGAAVPLTLVAAPAGSGKTTLLTEWARATALPVAWLSLEAADSELARFLAYLLAALRTLDERIGQQAGELLDTGGAPDPEKILSSLVNDLASYLAGDVALVLDDYHALASEAVHTSLLFLLDHLPEHLHLILGTRVDPPLPLARLRARGQLSELRADTLRFVPVEVKTFLQEMELDLAEDELRNLAERTEGWVAGVQLAALAMRGRADHATFLHDFRGSHRFILEYLSEEILARQTPRMRAFLLRTSVLERLSGSLCDALMEQSGSQAVLEELRRANLFVSALDDSGEWYRYHALFAEGLRHQLLQQEPDLYPQLCARASIWYEAHEMLYEACEYALQARDFERAVPLVERLVSKLIGRVEFFVLSHWLDQLPEEVISNRPLLQVAQAWVLLTNDDRQPEQLDQMLAQLHQRFQAHEGESDDVEWVEARANLNFILIMQALGQKNVEGAIELAQQTLQALPEDATYLRGLTSLCIRLAQGTAHRLSGDFAAAERIMIEAGAQFPTMDFHFLHLVATVSLIEMYEARGELRKIEQLYQRLLRMLRSYKKAPAELATWIYTGYAKLLLEWNRLDEAEEYMQQALVLDRRILIAEITLACHFIQLVIIQAMGKYTEAGELLHEMERDIASLQAPPPLIELVALARANLLLEQGKIEETLLWLNEKGLTDDELFQDPLPDAVLDKYVTLYQPTDPPQDALFGKCMLLIRVRIALGRVWAREELLPRTLIVLDRLYTKYEQAGFSRHLLEILILKSLALEVHGETKAALATLERAVILAEPAGFVRLFASEGEPMARLLARLPAQKSPTDAYVRVLLYAASAEHKQASAENAREEKPALAHIPFVEPLSAREMEVLELLAAGASNQEIADRLVIAPNTAKRHVKHILAKLAVNNRTQAAARAREVGLLYHP